MDFRNIQRGSQYDKVVSWRMVLQESEPLTLRSDAVGRDFYLLDCVTLTENVSDLCLGNNYHRYSARQFWGKNRCHFR